ncbi:MAG: transporter substrate-binding domain-containing protein [Candidatus Delongbacteria bacterium]|nr:transporter substrate-binding domain-containing protein [Candidatus Delongbacteria bacterium]
MNSRKKRLPLLTSLILMLVISIPAYAQSREKPLIIGADNNYPPFEFIDQNGELSGFNIELIREIAREMGMEIQIKSGIWSTLRQEFDDGKIDILSGMFYSESRLQTYAFSIPHSIISYAYFVHNDSDAVISEEQLKTKRIACQNNDIIHEYYKALGFDVFGENSPREALIGLARGHYDCCVVSKVVGLYYLRELKLKSIRITGNPFFIQKYCFAVRKSDYDLLARLNEGLYFIRSTPFYEKLYSKWLGESGPYPSRSGYPDYFIPSLSGAAILLLISLSWMIRLMINKRNQDQIISRNIQQIAEQNEVIRINRLRWECLLDTVDNGIWDWNLESGVVYFSNRWKEMLGYQPNELKSDYETWSSLLHPDDQKSVPAAVWQYIRDESPSYQIDCRMKTKSNNYRWIRTQGHKIRNEKGQCIGIIGSHIDIQTQMDLNAHLEQIRQQFNQLMKYTPDGILITDPNGIIQETNLERWESINPVFAQAKGMPVWELYRRLSPELENNSERTHRIKSIILDFLKTGKGKWLEKPIGHHIRDREGKDYFFQTISFPIQTPQGFRLGGISRDISGLQKSEKEKLSLQNQLTQAQKMEVVGILAGGLAHDFNNILGGITGTISLLQYYLSQNIPIERQQWIDSVMIIEKSAERATEIVKHVMALSRKPEIKNSVVDLVPMLTHIDKICRNTFDKSVEIKTETVLNQAIMMGDSTQIEQLFLNLCINACHAMTIMRTSSEAQGGTLSLILDKTHIPPPSNLIIKPGWYWSINICDTGVGIPPQNRDKVFDPFFTTKSKKDGSGLGLSIAYMITDRHGGAITLDSQPGIGTCFHVFLPVLEKTRDEDTVSPEENPGTILMIEDEEVVAQVASQMLSEYGYNVIWAANGIDGLEFYRQKAGKIDLIILDMGLPKLSGMDTLSNLKQFNPNLKILISSGSSITIPEHLSTSGKLDFIAKPYSMTELINKTRSMLQTD